MRLVEGIQVEAPVCQGTYYHLHVHRKFKLFIRLS